MSTMQGFHAITEVVADDRARIAFGRAGVHKDDRYAVSMADDGAILLTPLATIPRRELLVWENAQIRESLLRGLEQASRGEVFDRDDLLEDEDD